MIRGSHTGSSLLSLSSHKTQRLDPPSETGSVGGLWKESLPGTYRGKHDSLPEGKITWELTGDLPRIFWRTLELNWLFCHPPPESGLRHYIWKCCALVHYSYARRKGSKERFCSTSATSTTGQYFSFPLRISQAKLQSRSELGSMFFLTPLPLLSQGSFTKSVSYRWKVAA